MGEFPAPFPSMPHFMPTDDLMPPRAPAYDPFPSAGSPSSLALPYSFAPPSPPTSRDRLRPAVKLEPLHMHPGLFNLPPTLGSISDNDLSLLFPTIAPPAARVLNLSLWAEGMPPFMADIDRMNASASSRNPEATSVLIRVKMGISSMDDLHSHPNLHGFQGAITLSNIWGSQAKCITKSCIGPECVNSEVALLEVNPSPPAPNMPPNSVTCILPESWLTRCKWLPLGKCI